MQTIQRTLTYGEDCVGLNFNHGEGEVFKKVDKLKTLYAEIIDILNYHRGEHRDERARLSSIAITEAMGAQMWAVKAVTKKTD